MDAEKERLRAACSEAKALAYAPYSSFRVGAAVLFDDDTIVKGANVENASFGAGVCAERSALITARMEGKASQIKAIAVTTDTEQLVSPCGICRQFIREFASLEVPIYMFTNSGDLTVSTLEELLPLSFGPDNLLVKRAAN